MRQETLLRIIKLLRENMRGLTILEISKKLKIGYRPAYMHISEMAKQKIINIELIGNSKKCTLNIRSQKTIRLLTETDDAKIQKLPLIADIAKNLIDKNIAGISSIILFGSYAKGANKKNSDIDLLIIISDLQDKELRKSVTSICASYYYSHNLQVNPILVDVEELRKMLRSKELNIGKEAKDYGIVAYGAELFWMLNE